MKAIILAGGGGSRLFPLSRQSYPKQFLDLEDDTSLLAHTVKRFLAFLEAEDIVIVTNQKYVYHVENELRECGAEQASIVLEPVGRNTAPAIALASSFCETKLGSPASEVVIVAPADHVIRPIDKFRDCVKQAEKVAADGALVTFGIPASSPETGYGYIEAGERDALSYHVNSFKEKPDLAMAERYVAAGNYFWNSGMFAFSLQTLWEELTAYEPDIMSVLADGYDRAVEDFASMPNISVDYAVAERSHRVRMVPLSCYWNDIGSWDAMYDIMPKDADGNALRGDCLTLGCRNSLIMGRDRLIAGIGLDDLLLVETNDVIVAAKKGESQKVKDVVELLKKQGRKEATQHTTMYHSWGTSTVIGSGSGYRLKKVKVMPGKKILLQMHYHRSEHWIILRGTAEVIRGDERMMIHESESVFIPQTMKHELANPGRIPLELIEVQSGSYIGEDDIVRYED